MTNELFPLYAILCGLEKSGTTVLSEVLRRHPELDSGHEVGVLLAPTPRDFPGIQPYFSYFQKTWKLSRDEALACCDTDDIRTFYLRARQASSVIANKRAAIFDKTPRYMKYLPDVLDKVPGLPCIVNVRDPRAVMHSWACWSGHKDAPGVWLEQNFESNRDRYLSYARGYRDAELTRKHRLFLNRFEIMTLEPEQTLSSIFEFLGLSFDRSFMYFESEHFVYGNTISSDYLFPYRKDFTSHLCDRILEATAEFSGWHFHG